MNRLNKTESAVFLYCRFSAFLKDLFIMISDEMPRLVSFYLDTVCKSTHQRVSRLRSVDKCRFSDTLALFRSKMVTIFRGGVHIPAPETDNSSKNGAGLQT